ncbi:T9SS type A sorting domain-containing protein [Flammeovirga sp. MY04]|uniref:IPT/TIG domain-containing protein n=1 Tax=Flammeovirga sp. MY04 TaxID=1191459 RepID=UPI0008064264|nr:IPT/TIG domain-containing protein [Flammeovirga sp. MY04]ANQ52551.1 T9SS type A sorting domain-containing protein [Flammeovirga sp. MY04]
MKQSLIKIYLLCFALCFGTQSIAQEITDFYPKETTTSGIVTVVGSGLSNMSGVVFNGIDVLYKEKVSDTQIIFAVPPGATTGTFFIKGPDVTSTEEVIVDNFSKETLGTIDFTNASGKDGDATLDPSSPYNFYQVSGSGLAFGNNGYSGGAGDNLGIYQGASGVNYGVVNSADPGSVIIMDGISTEGYGELSLAFGFSKWKDIDPRTGVSIEYRDKANNGSWTALDIPYIKGQVNKWYYWILSDGMIPQTSDLEFRFTLVDPEFRYRIDDISVMGKLLPPYANFQTSNLSINENDAPIEIEVSLSKAAAEDITLTLSTSGTLEETDFSLTDMGGVNAENTITILAGETTGKALLSVVDNDIEEDTRTLDIEITSASSPVEIGQNNQITITVFDDDSPATLYNLTVDKSEIVEGSGETIEVTALFTKEVEGDQTVTIELPADRTHQRAYTLDTDFSFTVNSGTKIATATFAVVDDEILEVSEEVVLSVKSIEGGALVGDPVPSVSFMVHDDELPKVSLSISEDVVSEADAPEVMITVTSEVPLRSTETIQFSITGTGIDQDDYEVYSSTGDKGVAEFIINAGESQATATIKIIRDGVTEGNEIMDFDITSATSGIHTDFPETISLTILDEYFEIFVYGPETFGWRENPSIETYYNNGYFDITEIAYSGTARIGKRTAAEGSAQQFDSYVNFEGNKSTNIVMSGLNTLAHDDLRLGFDLIPVHTRGQSNAEADFIVEYSTDEGITFKALLLEWNHTGTKVFERMQIAGFLPQSDNLTLRFTNLEDNNDIGWWMDNVGVYHDNPRPEITLSVDKNWVLEVGEEVVTLTATLSEALPTNEYVFLNNASGIHIVDGESVKIMDKTLFFPAGTTEVSTTIKVYDNDLEEYGKQLHISAASTSAGISDRVIPHQLVIDIYDDDKPGPGEYFFKETLNNPNNLEPKSWGDRLPPTYLNRSNRPWSNMNDHVRYQHFWNAKDFLITGNANISCESLLGGMSREEHSDWNMGAEKYEGASGAHYFFFNENGMYVIFDNINVYRPGTTLRFGMYRFENWNTDGSELIVEYSTDGLRTWHQMTFDGLPYQPNWFRVTMNEDIPMSGNVAIRFKVEHLTGANIVKVDDIEIIARETKITSISNDYAKRGDEIVIKGESFIGVNSVQIGNVQYTSEHYTVENSTTIRFTIPANLEQGGMIKVNTSYGQAEGPLFTLDDRALASLFIEKNELQESTQEQTVIYAELDVPAREDSYIQLALLSNPDDITLSSDRLFIAEGETMSEEVTVTAVLDDFIAEPDEIVTIGMSSVISGHVDISAQSNVDVTIINEHRFPITYRVIAADTLYEDTKDEVLVFATTPFELPEAVNINFTISGTADENDYTLSKETPSIQFGSGDQISDTLHIKIVNDGVKEELETLVISSDEDISSELFIIPAYERMFYIKDGHFIEDEEDPTSIEDQMKWMKVWSAKGQLNIVHQKDKAIGEVYVYNTTGQLIQTWKSNTPQFSQPFPYRGIYIVRIFDGEQVYNIKVIAK